MACVRNFRGWSGPSVFGSSNRPNFGRGTPSRRAAEEERQEATCMDPFSLDFNTTDRLEARHTPPWGSIRVVPDGPANQSKCSCSQRFSAAHTASTRDDPILSLSRRSLSLEQPCQKKGGGVGAMTRTRQPQMGDGHFAFCPPTQTPSADRLWTRLIDPAHPSRCAWVRGPGRPWIDARL